jgi:ribosome-associated translation inhibitor RaiA
MIDADAVEVSTEGEVPSDELAAMREQVASLDRYTDEPILGARLTLRSGPGRTKNRYVADAHVVIAGRVLAAHVAAPNPREATEAAVERLRRQLRRVVGAEVARRNEPDNIRKAIADLEPDSSHRPKAGLKPPEEREIVRRRTYAAQPEATLEAVSEMLDLDEEFHLFVHIRTREDAVVHWREDRRVGLIHPRGSELADESNDTVVAEESWYSEPVPLDTVKSEMDVANPRFLYFTDAADGRGKVIYLRHDGDYGLVEPE